MSTESVGRTCPTCGHARNPDEFYETSVECRPCKRARSRRNRALVASKVALADRLIEVLERLVAQGWGPESLMAPRNWGPEGVRTASGPSTEPREVQP